MGVRKRNLAVLTWFQILRRYPPLHRLASAGEAHLFHMHPSGQSNLGGERHRLKQTHNVPGHVQLPPFKAVASRILEGVMVVVPSFPEGEQGYPPIVTREIACIPGLAAPYMAGGVDEPGDMVHPHDTHPLPESPQEK